MANHIETLLNAIAVPSERIEFESKKNVESFFKSFKKKKRTITTKLNKNQININQIIPFHENLINSLDNIKKIRINNIISLTKTFIEDFTYPTKTDGIENYKRAASEKLSLEETLQMSVKKPKLMAVVEHKKSSSLFENDSNLSVVSDNLANMTENRCNYGSNDNPVVEIAQNESTQIQVVEKVDVIKNKSISSNEALVILHEIDEAESLDNANETTPFQDDVGKQLINKSSSSSEKNDNKILSNKTVSPSKISGGIVYGKSIKTSNVSKVYPMQIGDKSTLKTPQQGLYKSKYHNDFSNSKSISKSQTLSVTKKYNMASKAPITKLEAIKTQKQQDNSKIKDIQSSLVKITTSKQTPLTSKFGATSKKVSSLSNFSQKTSKIVAPLTLKKTPSTNLKISSLNKPLLPSVSKVTNSKTFPQPNLPKVHPNEKMPSSILQLQNNTHVAMPTIPMPTQNSIIDDSIFKTPFSKKRLTTLTDSCVKIIESQVSYDISDLIDVGSNDEDEDYENRSRHNIPEWCKKSSGTLCRLVKYQAKQCIFNELFRDPASIPIDIRQIFGANVSIIEGCLEEWNKI